MAAYFRQDWVETPDGARLFFAVHGDGEPALPTMVLCDGLGCDGFAWKYLLPQLRDRYRVVRWHYRGHGKSSMPKDPARIGMLYTCDDLALLLDHVGVKKAVLFGHSMGTQVALEFHRRHAARVVGLALVCGSYGNPLDTWHDHTLLRRAFPILRDVIERFPGLARAITGSLLETEVAVEFAIRTELNPDLIKKEDFIPYMHHLACMDPIAFVRTLDSLKDHSAWDHLAHVDVPTLVIGGAQDRFTPVWLSRRMADAIPEADFMLVPGGSHTAPLEQPEVIGKRVERFLRDRVLKPRAFSGVRAAS